MKQKIIIEPCKQLFQEQEPLSIQISLILFQKYVNIVYQIIIKCLFILSVVFYLKECILNTSICKIFHSWGHEVCLMLNCIKYFKKHFV